MPSRSFTTDNRGVSAIIGAILLFGILVLALAGYQANIVPQENSQAEFQHMEQIDNEMATLKGGILTAGQANQPHFQTIKLGTTYPNRVFTINPPPSSGTIETSEEYEIRIEDSEEIERTIPTRFISYTPQYFEMDSGQIWIDNSVLYLDERYLDSRQGGTAIKEEQSMIRGSQRLHVTAIQNDFRKQDIQAVNIEVYPTEEAEEVIDDLEGELEVALPTRLNDSEYWEVIESETKDIENITYEGTNEIDETSDGIIHEAKFTLSDPDDLLLSTVGVDAVPDDKPSQSEAFIESMDTLTPQPHPPERQDVIEITDVTRDTSGGSEEDLIFSVSRTGEANPKITDLEVEASGADTFESGLIDVTGGFEDGLDVGLILPEDNSANGERIIQDPDAVDWDLEENEPVSYRLRDFNTQGNIQGDDFTIRIYYEIDGEEEAFEETITPQ